MPARARPQCSNAACRKALSPTEAVVGLGPGTQVGQKPMCLPCRTEQYTQTVFRDRRQTA